MKPRHILFLAILFAALLAGLVVQKFQKPAELVTEEYAPLQISLDRDKVAKIELEKPAPKDAKSREESKPAVFFTMVRQKEVQPETWRIPEFSNTRADQSHIDQLLKNIREAKGELRSKDPFLFKDFGLDDETAIRLSFFDEAAAELLTLFVGNKRIAPANVFIRQKGSDLVHLIDKDLLSDMGIYGDPAKENPKIDFWANLKFLALEVEKLQSLEARRVEDGKEIVTSHIVREVDPEDNTKRKWKYLRPGVPFAPDAEKVRSFLDALKGWNANQVLPPDPGKDYGFDKPKAQIKLGLEEGGEVLILIGEKDPESSAYFLKISTEPLLYKLADYYFQSFKVDDSKFFINDPLGVDPDRTVKLVVHSPEKEISFKPNEKKWGALTEYLNELKNLSANRLLFASADQKAVKSPGKAWLEIQKDNGPSQILDFGEMILDQNQNKEYTARKRDGTEPFTISESTHKKLFENLERLAEPKA